jgi:hypothetical protein
MTKKKNSKKYGLLPLKIAESDIRSMGHGLCAFDGSIYHNDTIQNNFLLSLLELTMIHPERHQRMV